MTIPRPPSRCARRTPWTLGRLARWLEEQRPGRRSVDDPAVQRRPVEPDLSAVHGRRPLRAAAQAAGRAAALGARRRPRVPHPQRARGQRRARAARAVLLRRRQRGGHAVLSHGVRRRADLLEPRAARPDTARTRRRLRRNEPRDRGDPRDRPRRRRPRGFRPPRELRGAPDRALEQAVPRQRARAHRFHGAAHRLAAAARAARRARAHHARRLPHRQPHLRPPRAAHPRGHRLGARDARQRALGLRVQLHAVPHARSRAQGPRRARSRAARHSVRAASTSSRYLRADRARRCARAAAFDFYIAFNLFRLASILQGVAARARLGNASSEHATEAGSLTRPIADLGWAQARGVH